MKAYKQETAISRKITRSFTSNSRFTVFLFCMLIATVCWIFTALNKSYTGHFSFRLDYHHLPFRKNITSELPRTLDVELQARGFDLIAYSFRQKLESLEVDVESLTAPQGASRNSVMIPTRNILTREVTGIQPEMTLKHITPEYITFDFSPKFRKKVRVKPDVSVTCKQQFFAPFGCIVKPDSIEIAGSAEALARILFVETQPLHISQLNHKTIRPLDIKLPAVAGIEINPAQVWAYIPVEELAEADVEVPVELNDAGSDGLLVLPDKVRITYQVPLKIIDQVNTEEFRVCARMRDDGQPESRHTRLELCHIPAGVYRARIQPGFINILSAR